METASKIWSFINAQEPKVMNTTYIYIYNIYRDGEQSEYKQ